MNENNIKGRLQWLATALTTQRNNLAQVLSRLKSFGAHAGSSPAVYPKFMQLLTQVAIHREKEDSILDEIEAMEKRHQALKMRKGLRRATSQPVFEEEYKGRKSSKRYLLRRAPQEAPCPTTEGIGFAPPPQRSGLWKWLLLFYLLSANRSKNRQDITYN